MTILATSLRQNPYPGRHEINNICRVHNYEVESSFPYKCVGVENNLPIYKGTYTI